MDQTIRCWNVAAYSFRAELDHEIYVIENPG